MRLIDADWLKNKATPRDRNGITEFITSVLFGLINQAPTIEAEPVRHGSWSETYDPGDGFMAKKYYCSACGDWNTYGKSPYCPACGAKMEVNGEEK